MVTSRTRRENRAVPDVLVDDARRRVTIGDWSRRVVWVRHEGHTGWAASLEIARNVSLLIDVHNGALEVSLWAGEPKAAPGAAVLMAGDRLRGLARVPVCTCGEQGCSDASLQLHLSVAAEELPALVATLESLPLTTMTLNDRVWDGGWHEG
jgi:hypothetical protein